MSETISSLNTLAKWKALKVPSSDQRKSRLYGFHCQTYCQIRESLTPESERPTRRLSESGYTVPTIHKLRRFDHEKLGKLNSCVCWLEAKIIIEGDNPPVGILLCTDKNRSLAKYALAGMDDQLFIAKYQFELHKKEEMQRFIDEQIDAMLTSGNEK